MALRNPLECKAPIMIDCNGFLKGLNPKTLKTLPVVWGSRAYAGAAAMMCLLGGSVGVAARAGWASGGDAGEGGLARTGGVGCPARYLGDLCYAALCTASTPPMQIIRWALLDLDIGGHPADDKGRGWATGRHLP